MKLDVALAEMPLVAILRGLRPESAKDVGHCLIDQGFRIVEVPLNSPDPLRSIEKLATALSEQAVIGAGTVLAIEDVGRIADVGGRLVVMPHNDAAVIRAACARGLDCLPGVATPSEAFAALKAGAFGLKAFPAEALPPSVIKAWRAVVPKSVSILPVGGIKPECMRAYIEAGASGFGLGSALFTSNKSINEITKSAKAFTAAWREIAELRA